MQLTCPLYLKTTISMGSKHLSKSSFLLTQDMTKYWWSGFWEIWSRCLTSNETKIGKPLFSLSGFFYEDSFLDLRYFGNSLFDFQPTCLLVTRVRITITTASGSPLSIVLEETKTPHFHWLKSVVIFTRSWFRIQATAVPLSFSIWHRNQLKLYLVLYRFN